MKYLITGGCGFLGTNLSREVLRRKEELVIFDNLSRYGSMHNLKWLNSFGKFTYVHGDIRNYNDIEKVILDEKPDAVFHLAGQVAMTTSLSDPRKDFETNAVGTHNLIEAIRRRFSTVPIFYSSTNKVYGDLESFSYMETPTRYICEEYPTGFDESIPLNFQSPYGCSKGCADQYLLDYHRIYGLKTVVFRHSSMYGGRQFASYDQGWVGWFCKKALEVKAGSNELFTISGNGKQVRDLLFSDDVVRLYFNAVEKIDEASGEVFNIGGGGENSLSILELLSLLEGKLDIRMFYKELPKRISDQKVFIANIDKVNKKLGWSPSISKEEGIDQMIAWLDVEMNNKLVNE